MAKHAPKAIKPGWSPGQTEDNPHKAALRDHLLAAPLTFEGARKRYEVGADKGMVAQVAATYWTEHQELPPAAVETWAFAEFWKLEAKR